MEDLGNDFETTLTAAITSAGQTTVTVASLTGAPSPNFRILIDDELILVTGVASLTITMTRGIEGTTATTHSNGAEVFHVVTKGGLDTYSRESGQILRRGIATGDTLVVPDGHQLIVGGGYTIDGTLQLDGDAELIVVS